MSVRNFSKNIYKFTHQYVNPDPVDMVELSSYGLLRSREYFEEQDDIHFIDNFDDYAVVSVDSESATAGSTFATQGEVDIKVKLTRKINVSNSGSGVVNYQGIPIDVDTSSTDTFSGEVTIKFKKKYSYFLSYSNFIKQSIETKNLRKLQDRLIDSYNERGKEWKKSYVLVTARILALGGCSFMLSTSKKAGVNQVATITADKSLNLEVGETLSGDAASSLGISFDSTINISRGTIWSVTDEDACVPILEYHKLKGYGRNLRLSAVR